MSLLVTWTERLDLSSEISIRHPPATLPGWPAKHNPAYLVHARHGAAATENVLCSEIAVDVLKDGGNAVDASIAATLCVGVVSMYSSGIGGGGFMTVRIPGSSPESSSEGWTVDFRETAPAAANATMFSHDPMSSVFGGLSVGVPGELRGLSEAHRRWGTLPWKRLVEPAAHLAEGWEVGIELGKRIQLYSKLMLENPDWRSVFAPNGELLREGDLIRRTNYSRTLHTIAEQGAEAFYSGPIANALIEKIHATGGILTAADFAGYTPLVKPALKGSYKNRTVYTSQAPTSGPVLLHMLNLLEKFDMNEANQGLRLHRFVEVLKLPTYYLMSETYDYLRRTRVFDPAFANETTSFDYVPTKEYADKIFPNITDSTTHSPEYYQPVFDVAIDHGTSHSSIVDASGMAVAITSTVNLVFGSQVLDPITGIILNDELDDFGVPGRPNAFGLKPSPYNYPAPGKRPLSSTCPTILEHPDGSFYLTLGGSGGSMIFGAVAQVILGVDAVSSGPRDKNGWVDVSMAVEGPRAHNQLFPLEVFMDSTFDQKSIDALQTRGHNTTGQPYIPNNPLTDINRIAAVVQAVMAKDGEIFAASDSRKNGIAAGY
ncbi:gamma-glutamyltranspeptidase [Gautieria morchelliformis]|nr:gamma-glutamyltranspeptidase [Gautieria morchelliformis]